MSCEIRAFVRTPVSMKRLKHRVHTALRLLRYNPRTTNVSLVFVGDARMRSLNARYRKRRSTTDVLSFPGTGHELGDIIISVPQARRQAREKHHPLIDELELLAVHGVLHLAGYDHERAADRKRMERLETRFLERPSPISRAG